MINLEKGLNQVFNKRKTKMKLKFLISKFKDLQKNNKIYVGLAHDMDKDILIVGGARKNILFINKIIKIFFPANKHEIVKIITKNPSKITYHLKGLTYHNFNIILQGLKENHDINYQEVTGFGRIMY